MDSKDKLEWMSALADGQLRGDDLARGLEMAADEQALEAWRTYHLVGDVLRSAEFAACSPADRFLARVQERLAAEPAPAAAPLPAPAAPVPVAARREAANDGVFRWKLAAGFASIAAVGAIGWSLVAAPRGDGASMAAAPASATSPTLVVGSERGPVIRDARLDELLAAHRQFAGATAPQAFLRNATYDAAGR